MLSFRVFIFWAKNIVIKSEQLVADIESNRFLFVLLIHFILRIESKTACIQDKHSVTELLSQPLEVF